MELSTSIDILELAVLLELILIAGYLAYSEDHSPEVTGSEERWREDQLIFNAAAQRKPP